MLSFAKFCVSSESNGVARNRESPRLLSVPKKGPTAKTARVLRARRRATALVSSLEAPRWHRRRARQWRQVRPPEAGQHKAAGRGQGSQAKRHRHARDRPSAEPGCFDDLPLAGGAKGAGGCLITLEPKQFATGRKKLERTPPPASCFIQQSARPPIRDRLTAAKLDAVWVSLVPGRDSCTAAKRG